MAGPRRGPKEAGPKLPGPSLIYLISLQNILGKLQHPKPKTCVSFFFYSFSFFGARMEPGSQGPFGTFSITELHPGPELAFLPSSLSSLLGLHLPNHFFLFLGIIQLEFRQLPGNGWQNVPSPTLTRPDVLTWGIFISFCVFRNQRRLEESRSE